MGGSAPGTDTRTALAAAAFGAGGVASYALQRWTASLAGEPTPDQVFAQAHVPLTWRVWISLLHGAALAAASYGAVRGAAADRALGRAPYVLVPLVAAAATAVALRP